MIKISQTTSVGYVRNNRVTLIVDYFLQPYITTKTAHENMQQIKRGTYRQPCISQRGKRVLPQLEYLKKIQRMVRKYYSGT